MFQFQFFIFYSDKAERAPAWADAATKLKGKMNLGALDATQHGSTAQEYGVQVCN